MRIVTLGLIVGAVLVTQAGCEDRTAPPNNVPPPAGDAGINIRWPGGSVQIDPNSGETQVDAGPVKVDAGGGKGATVIAPNVDVDAGGGRGVHVRTPNANVDVNR
jgi:hypothetical protein